MYSYFQPRQSVEQEEADIQELIDKEYECREQEEREYWKRREQYEKNIADPMSKDEGFIRKGYYYSSTSKFPFL